MTANDRYVEHREHCYECGAVDIGMHRAFRCMKGIMLVKAAQRESLIHKRVQLRKHGHQLGRKKPFITAQDFIFMKQLAIKL